jgi:hypothetical protein
MQPVRHSPARRCVLDFQRDGTRCAPGCSADSGNNRWRSLPWKSSAATIGLTPGDAAKVEARGDRPKKERDEGRGESFTAAAATAQPHSLSPLASGMPPEGLSENRLRRRGQSPFPHRASEMGTVPDGSRTGHSSGTDAPT